METESRFGKSNLSDSPRSVYRRVSLCSCFWESPTTRKLFSRDKSDFVFRIPFKCSPNERAVFEIQISDTLILFIDLFSLFLIRVKHNIFSPSTLFESLVVRGLCPWSGRWTQIYCGHSDYWRTRYLSHSPDWSAVCLCLLVYLFLCVCESL